jgi:RNA polymerase sigma factor (sigma-70 family)
MGLAQETDENLMLRFGRGEAAAFEFLYQRHESRVFRYLRRNVKNEATANDLMQEVWFAVVRGAGNYQPTAKFTTWLFTIAHNRMVDMIRANHRLQSLDAAEVADPEGRHAEDLSLLDRLAADRKLEPLAQVQSQDEAAALLIAVEQLPAEQRSAFLLQAEGELSVEEIAVATGSNFETVKSRLRYARAKLRQLLWEYA